MTARVKESGSRKYNRYFRGRNVVILPDNDRTGLNHAEEIATSVVGVAASVRVLKLPGLPEKGDVSDWLDAGGTPQELNQLSRASPLWIQRIELKRPRDEFQDRWELRLKLEEVLNLALKPQEKLLLIVLEAGIARPRPTQKTLAAAAGLSSGRVKKILADLRKRQIISVCKRGRENEYDVRGSWTL
jgi:uncharacterized membrane protein